MLAGAAERVSSAPERAEAELQRVVSETRALLAPGRVVPKAEISERRVVQFGEGDPAPDAAVEGVPIMRGARGRFGRLFSFGSGAPVSEQQVIGLRAAASWSPAST